MYLFKSDKDKLRKVFGKSWKVSHAISAVVAENETCAHCEDELGASHIVCSSHKKGKDRILFCEKECLREYLNEMAPDDPRIIASELRSLKEENITARPLASLDGGWIKHGSTSVGDLTIRGLIVATRKD